MDKLSYALGMSLGQRLIETRVEKLNFDDFKNGVKDVFTKENPQLTPEEGNQILNEYFTKLQEAENKLKQEVIIKNGQAAEEFLKKNANEPSVEVTASGLQYKVITKGDGKQPGPHSQVKCHYEGKLSNGQIFDSSYNRGTPATFGLHQVIPGWTEGLQLMNIGSKYVFYIPPQLGYGENGIPGVIPENSVLIFTVELLDIL